MIYNDKIEYKTKFYQNIRTGKIPALDYIERLSDKEKAKVLKFIEFLQEKEGYLEEPYSKHIKGKIRELRIDFGRKRHRIFYFVFIKKTIVLLHAFLKKTPKTPIAEIKRAEENYYEVLRNPKIYE